MNGAWNALDGILYINLDASEERRSVFLERNTGVMPAEKIHRISAVYGRTLPTYGKAPWFGEHTGERAPYWGGVAGCILSHRRAIQKARDEGWRHVLILEDDVAAVGSVSACAMLTKALETLTGPYLLYLGYSRPTTYGRMVAEQGEHELWQIEGVVGAFAYVVSQDLYDSLLESLPTEDEVWDWISRYRAIDTFYQDYVPHMPGVKIYAIQPDIVVHIDGSSDVGADTHTDSSLLSVRPHRYSTFGGLLHRLGSPFRRLKIHLNSLRTAHRARKGGFPGYRKKRKK